MATASDSTHPAPSVTHDLDEDDVDEEFDDDGGDSPASSSEAARLEAVLRRLTADEVRIRVHQVTIRGCARTRRRRPR
jgi:outer membrane protein insertion porin family